MYLASLTHTVLERLCINTSPLSCKSFIETILIECSFENWKTKPLSFWSTFRDTLEHVATSHDDYTARFTTWQAPNMWP